MKRLYYTAFLSILSLFLQIMNTYVFPAWYIKKQGSSVIALQET